MTQAPSCTYGNVSTLSDTDAEDGRMVSANRDHRQKSSHGTAQWPFWKPCFAAFLTMNVFWSVHSFFSHDSQFTKNIQPERLMAASNLNVTPSVPDTRSQGKAKSSNEHYYDAKYFQWQAALGEYGGAVKGDMFKALTPPGTNKIMEFGCGGGFIINAVGDAPTRDCVEINPHARAFAVKNFPHVRSVERVDQLPEPTYDMIFSSSVIEHVDCPLCTIRELVPRLAAEGVLILNVVNDGYKRDQDEWHANDRNMHIYTWNALLLGNLATMGGFHTCHCVSIVSSWANLNLTQYLEDKFTQCQRNLAAAGGMGVLCAVVQKGNEGQCTEHRTRLERLRNCEYLKM